MEIPNRIVRSATAERGADERGKATGALADTFKTLAQGGTGLIITGHAFVHPHGKTNNAMTGAHSDNMIPGLEKIAKAVHQNSDAKVFLQINHAGRVTSQALIGTLPAGPSPIPVKMSGEEAREFSSDEIEELVEIYVQAVRRGMEAGFDGVQLHCAHGYLISQFLSGYTNRRTDKWGNDKRLFLMRIVDEIKTRMGNFPLAVKINCEDYVPDGVTIAEFVETCKILDKKGISFIEVSGGIPEAGGKAVRKGINAPEKEGYFLYAGKALKEAGIHIPVAVAGGFRSKSVCENALERGETDMVSFCRPLITEPDLPNQWKNGREEKSRCIACNSCLTKVKEMTHCVYWEEEEK